MKKTLLLIIENDLDICVSLQEFLEGEGYNIVYVSNGKEALDYLKVARVLPALILLDLRMPVMNGFEFLEQQRLEPKYASIPVIIMSADGCVPEKLLKTSAAAYLPKPFELEKLINSIESLTRNEPYN